MNVNDLTEIGVLTGDERVLVVRAGVAGLALSSDVALAPCSLAIDATASPLDQAKDLKRKAMMARATMTRGRLNNFQVSVLAGMPGALLEPSIGAQFNEQMAAVSAKLDSLLAAVDAAATIEEVDAVVW